MKFSGPFFAPPDGPGDVGAVGSDVDLLNEVDNEQPADKKKETPEKKEKEPDAGAEGEGEGDEGDGDNDNESEVDLLDEETDETDEKDKEDVEEGEEGAENDAETDKETENLVDGRVDLKKVKEKYPKLFKDFPGLRENFFKGINYDKMFGSIEAAEVVQSKSDNYDVIEQSFVNDGDPTILFKELQENNPKALNKVLDNWLPKLLELDEDLYIRASRPALDRLLSTAHRVAKARLSKNDKDKSALNLQYAAEHIANFIYGSPDIPDVGDGKTKPNPEREEIETEKRNFATQKFNDFDGRVHDSIQTTLRTKIAASLPKSLPKLVKETIVERTMGAIDDQLGKDKAHLSGIKSLYNSAIRGGYPRESEAKIVNAYLARANSIVNPIRNRYLKDAGHEVSGNGQSQQSTKRNISGKNTNRNDGAQTRRSPDAKQVDWRKTSDMDILNDKATLRK